MKRMPIPIRITLTIFFLAVVTAMSYAQNPIELKVRYLSADRVYLDGGQEKGVSKYDQFVVLRDGEEIATLEVVQCAASSSSCRLIEVKKPLQVGDKAKLVKKATEATEPNQVAKSSRRRQFESKAPTTKSRRKTLRGSISAQVYGFQSKVDGQRDYNQPSLRLNLRGRGLAQGGYDLRLRTRARYVEHPLSDGERVDAEWQNRLYEASFRYVRPGSRIHYGVGRLASNQFSGVGYIDGGQMSLNVGDHSRLGLFAGVQPEWQQAKPSSSIKKYGLSYGFQKERGPGQRFQSNLALVGEYHGSEINREYAYLQNVFQGEKLYLFQSAELEINRDWRRDAANTSTELSHLFLVTQYRFTPDFSMGLSYDNRNNYYTYEFLSRDALYFDQLNRQGLRLNMQWRFAGFNTNMSYNTRDREGDESQSDSYYVNIYRNRLFDRPWSVNMRVNGFDNPTTRGFNPSMRVGYHIVGGHTLYLGYSNYDYQLKDGGPDRQNQWVRFAFNLYLGRHLFCLGEWEQNLGDDAEGQRYLLELGYRL